jgi:hypothetical protein
VWALELGSELLPCWRLWVDLSAKIFLEKLVFGGNKVPGNPLYVEEGKKGEKKHFSRNVKVPPLVYVCVLGVRGVCWFFE